ncbi:MAG TPA: DUF1214 domain-containing protein [Saliniramus sp.]|nr:DUF1214 domain-containing protein [Saliniramus sp.]
MRERLPLVGTIRDHQANRMSFRMAARFNAAFNVLLIVYAVLLGLAGGLMSALWVVEGEYPFGRREAQAWTAWPALGSREIDPYARAILARNGDIPLGIGEGLAFRAAADDTNLPLDGSCTYTIAGATPPARYWTMTLYDSEGRHDASPTSRSSTTSARILRDEEGRMEITLSRDPQPGNWLIPPVASRFQIVFRLYDTPVSGTLSWVTEGSLPTIRRGECRS